MSLRKQLLSPRSPVESQAKDVCKSRSPSASPYSSFHDSSPSDELSPRSINSPSTSKALLDQELMLLPYLSVEEIHLKEKKLMNMSQSLYLVPIQYKLEAILNLTQALENAALKIRRETVSSPSQSSCFPLLWKRSNKVLPESKERLHFVAQDAYSLEEEFADNIKLLINDTLASLEIVSLPITEPVYKNIFKTFKIQFNQNLDERFFKKLKTALDHDELCLFGHFVKRCYDILDADVKIKSLPRLLPTKKPRRPGPDYLAPPVIRP